MQCLFDSTLCWGGEEGVPVHDNDKGDEDDSRVTRTGRSA